MKVIQFTEIQIKQFIETIRPPKEMRDQVDVSYSFKKDIVEVFEIRPKWDDEKAFDNFEIARAKYIKSKSVWKIYWMNSNLKWIQYKPVPEVENFSKFIEILKKDENGCFWG